jgi:hypothetical protein
MAVLSMITIRVKPGRTEEFLGLVRELGEIEARVGANLRSMRLFESLVGGAEPGQLALLFEYDDLASWGATVDAERKDESFNAQVGSADDPAETVGQTLFVEIPI